MEKNQLKWYETPAMEVVELEAKISLLAGSGGLDDEPQLPGGDEEY